VRKARPRRQSLHKLNFNRTPTDGLTPWMKELTCLQKRSGTSRRPRRIAKYQQRNIPFQTIDREAP
jgi:hypothetical protein